MTPHTSDVCISSVEVWMKLKSHVSCMSSFINQVCFHLILSHFVFIDTQIDNEVCEWIIPHYTLIHYVPTLTGLYFGIRYTRNTWWIYGINDTRHPSSIYCISWHQVSGLAPAGSHVSATIWHVWPFLQCCLMLLYYIEPLAGDRLHLTLPAPDAGARCGIVLHSARPASVWASRSSPLCAVEMRWKERQYQTIPLLLPSFPVKLTAKFQNFL